MNVLIVGTGMYVSGRGTDGIGTLFPATLKYAHQTKEVTKVTFLATSEASKKSVLEKVDQAKKTLGFEVDVKVFVGDLDSALQSAEFGCAIVATPDQTHYEITKKLLENKLHTLVVKPLATTLEHVQSLVQIAKDNGVYGMVEFHKRFDRSNKYLKTVMEDKKIGDPLYFLVQYSQKKVIPEVVFDKWLDQTNIFQYLGIHYVDIIYFATGAKPKRVMSLGQKSYLKSKGIENYDSIQTVIEWEREDGHKFTGNFLTNWVEEDNAPAMSDQRIKVIGTKGRLEANQKDRGIQVVDSNSYEEVNPDFCRLYRDGDSYDIDGYGVESVLTFFRDIKSLKEGEKTLDSLEANRPTFFQSIEPTKVIEASNKSLEMNGAWVEIE